MGKKEQVLDKIRFLKEDGTQRITMTDMHVLLRQCNIIPTAVRKEYIMWLEANGKIKIVGQTVELF